MKANRLKPPIHILLADDDRDDRYFFAKALEAIKIGTELQTVENGELLMKYLNDASTSLPDVLFLDLNMPRKNGADCLREIRASEVLKTLPVVIYSTSVHPDVADVLYKRGAQYYVRKSEFPELKRILTYILTLMLDKGLVQATREEFVINVVEA